MAGGSKSELPSNSPEGSTFTTSYPNCQRGHSGSHMERSGSFRESLESRVPLSGTGLARSPTPAISSETLPLSSSLILEPFSISEKYTHYGELRVVLGASLEEHSFGAIQSKPLPTVEELKHFKITMRETSTKARERAKMLHESIMKVDRMQNIVTRKRSRNEITSDKSAGVLKTGSQIHQNPSDAVLHRLEERTKNSLPNKRIRSSMADIRSEGRGSVMLRQGTMIDKEKSNLDREKNMLKVCNGGISEDKIRGLPAGGDGWDKNMKRKRSAGSLTTRIMDPERELKQGMQQRFKSEPRPRPSDGVGHRHGSSTTIHTINKLDGSSQQNFVVSRNLSKSDLDGLSIPNDRREPFSSFEKERTIAKGTTKLNIREDSVVGNQSPLTKGKSSRAPRTGSATATNSSSATRVPGGIDGWDQLPSLNKNQVSSVANNRKRPCCSGPPSPHVAQWVGQRPQRIRMRRPNLVSPVCGHDESQTMVTGSPASDIGARLSSTETTVSQIPKGTLGAVNQPSLKLDNTPSPALLSESDESGCAENKYKERLVNNGEGALNIVKKVSTVILPTKKNKHLKEEVGDGRRLGRNGRCTQSKSSFSMTKEKLENVQTTKSMRNGRSNSDRCERSAAPPPKKVSDRKAFTRPVHVSNCGTIELIAESEDDHEELFAAANYIKNTRNQTSTLFWKTVSPFFAFVGADSLALLKKQINFAEEIEESLCIDVTVKDEFIQEVTSHERKVNQANNVNHRSPNPMRYSIDEVFQNDGGKYETEGWLERVVPLSQRLLAAIIPEYEMDCNNDQQFSCSQFISNKPYNSSQHANNLHKEGEHKGLLEPESERTSQTQKAFSRDTSSCNGYAASNNFRSPLANSHCYSNGLSHHARNTLPCSEDSFLPEINHNSVGRMLDIGPDYEDLSSCIFQKMSLDEKILLELEGIGLQPEAVPDLSDGEDEQIDRDICNLKMKLYKKARSKKDELLKLQDVVQNARLLEEKKFERLSLDKLVEIAYRKVLAGRGSHGSSSKGGVNKITKQVALAFAKRTIARCRKFENTQKSCFGEPPYRNILFSAPSSRSATHDAFHSQAVAFAETDRFQPESHSLEPSSNIEGISGRGLDRSSRDFVHGTGPMPGQSFVKNEAFSGRGKKREVLLDDVVVNVLSKSNAIGSSIPGGAKGKRSERERDHNKDASGRGSIAKIGRPSLGPSRGERKTKTKTKQRTAQLSTTGSLVGRNAETDAIVPLVAESFETSKYGSEKGNECAISQDPGSAVQDASKEMEEIDFYNLPIDELAVGSELGSQVEDFWLNVDDDIMQDNDIMGLEIPMDDLTDLNMNF